MNVVTPLAQLKEALLSILYDRELPNASQPLVWTRLFGAKLPGWHIHTPIHLGQLEDDQGAPKPQNFPSDESLRQEIAALMSSGDGLSHSRHILLPFYHGLFNRPLSWPKKNSNGVVDLLPPRTDNIWCLAHLFWDPALNGAHPAVALHAVGPDSQVQRRDALAFLKGTVYTNLPSEKPWKFAGDKVSFHEHCRNIGIQDVDGPWTLLYAVHIASELALRSVPDAKAGQSFPSLEARESENSIVTRALSTAKLQSLAQILYGIYVSSWNLRHGEGTFQSIDLSLLEQDLKDQIPIVEALVLGRLKELEKQFPARENDGMAQSCGEVQAPAAPQSLPAPDPAAQPQDLPPFGIPDEPTSQQKGDTGTSSALQPSQISSFLQTVAEASSAKESVGKLVLNLSHNRKKVQFEWVGPASMDVTWGDGDKGEILVPSEILALDKNDEEAVQIKSGLLKARKAPMLLK